MRARDSGRAARASGIAGHGDRIRRQGAGRRRRDRAAGGDRECRRRCISRHRRELQRSAADAAARIGGHRPCATCEGRDDMKSAPFDYVRPKTVTEAGALLAQDGVNTAAIAGGQSLVPMLNLRVAQVDLLVDLSRLDELKAVSETPASLQIGALTSHASIEDGKIPDRFGGILRGVASTISYR